MIPVYPTVSYRRARLPPRDIIFSARFAELQRANKSSTTQSPFPSYHNNPKTCGAGSCCELWRICQKRRREVGQIKSVWKRDL
ncbi:hypothetical protein L596_017432 [Steinernema carpocapsae]|uniref:Uncharacterized protein n=1 Tax=Steinernema carpocapsae TaxID=34508 RepID=A0A4U5N1W7_STECR|nr:hypothetical protein L596_017432 [Steinernema carpocapsae]